MASHRRGSMRAPLLIAAACAAVVVAAGTGAVVAFGSGAAAVAGTRRTGATPKTYTSRGSGRSVTPSTPVGGRKSQGALRLTSESPVANAVGVRGVTPVVLTFSSPIAASSPMPTMSPSVPGSWKTSGATHLVFTPSTPWIPLSDVTLTVPGGAHGMRSSAGRTLASSVVETFHIEDGSTLRLQQLLSLLDYSPLAWSPSSRAAASGSATAQLVSLYTPPQGSFVWRQTTWPSELAPLWHPGVYDTFTRGLVMSFQADHGLVVNGAPSAGLWNDLLQSVASGTLNTGGYNYAVAVKTAPQTLTIWHNGQVVLHTSANTGIPQSPTPSGTFPVYARYRNYVMHGTNPNGSAYADPVQYVAYFYDGDAVHFFPRAAYGIPQSLGCIELPLAEAAIAWSYLAYGTPVTVLN